MTTHTVSQFEIPNDSPAVAEGSIEGGTRRDDQRGTKSKFLMLCFVLIFGLIYAIVYFTDSSNGPGRISAEGNNAPLVLPAVLP